MADETPDPRPWAVRYVQQIQQTARSGTSAIAQAMLNAQQYQDGGYDPKGADPITDRDCSSVDPDLTAADIATVIGVFDAIVNALEANGGAGRKALLKVAR